MPERSPDTTMTGPVRNGGATAAGRAGRFRTWRFHLREVELPVLGAADEGQPLFRGEQQNRPGLVLRVAKGHGPADEGDLDTVVRIGTAAGALAPGGTVEVDA